MQAGVVHVLRQQKGIRYAKNQNRLFPFALSEKVT